MKVKQAVEDYSYAIKRLSPNTQRGYLYKLGVFATWCEEEGLKLEDIRVPHVRRFIEYTRTLPNQQHPDRCITSSTVRGYVMVLKIFLNWCGKEDGLEDVVKAGVGKKVELPHADTHVIETFTPDQIKALYKACESEYREVLRVRDVALLSLLIDTGIRVSELISLKVSNVHLEKGDCYIRVFGKGRKEREVGLGERARRDVKKYLDRFRPKSESPILFLNRYSQPFTRQGMDTLITRLGGWAHIKGVRCSPHTFRHTFAINYLKQGGDLYKLSRLLGHAGVSITENYLRSFNQRDARNGGSVLDNL
jgi:site-specific recombinase XerD